MKDCSKDILKYHGEKVTLSQTIQSNLRDNRNANRDRIKRGLTKLEKPQPDDFIIQGSYAMKTMKQHPKNDYDIDDGASFAAAKLQNKDGSSLSPFEARTLVKDALVAGGGLGDTPKVNKNCVTISYAAGHHVDIPVYRILTDIFNRTTLEFASGDEWKDSNPTEITDWFRKTERNTLKEGEVEPQLRRLTRLMKIYSASNLGTDSLSGLLLTVLTAEIHLIYDSREDNAFRSLLRGIMTRLTYNRVIVNPANCAEILTKDKDSARCDLLISRIKESLKTLDVLDDPKCSQIEARAAWDRVFKTDFFSKLQMDEQAARSPTTPSDGYPDKRVNIQGPGTAA